VTFTDSSICQLQISRVQKLSELNRPT